MGDSDAIDGGRNSPAEGEDPAVTARAPAAPATIGKGRYELRGLLGTGGMGNVYEGRDTVLDRIVAIKILKWHGESDSVRRFHIEAKAAGRLQHRNSVSVLDFGQTENGDLYLIMEFLKGESLLDWLEANGPMPPHMVIPLFIRVCLGLSHAHEKGLVHRDIKPSNIFMAETSETGMQPKLVDFGVSRLTTDEQHITHTGVTVGSPNYVSPEQARGQTVDARSDIYSTGCTMFEALTGQTPFQSDQAVTAVLKHLSEEPPLLSDVCDAYEYPEELESIIAKCLAKDPADRFQTAEELRTALLKTISEIDSDTDSNLLEKNESEESAHAHQTITSVPRWLVVSAGILLVGLVAWLSVRIALRDQQEVITHITRDDYGTTGLGRAEQEKKDKTTARLDSVADGAIQTVRNRHDLVDVSETSTALEILPTFEHRYLYKLQEFKNLEILIASRSSFDDKGLEAISKIPNLEVLVLSGNENITDEGLKSLSRLSKLRFLNLDKTNISNTGLSYLLQNKALATLTVVKCKRVGDPGMQFLKQLPALKRLNVGETSITDAGVEQIIDSGKIEHLSVANCLITDRGLDSIMQCSSIKKLFLDNCKRISIAGIKKVSAMPNLKRLCLKGTKVNDDAVESLSKMKSLQRLDIRDSACTNKSVQNLSTTANLVMLALSGTKVNESGLACLKDFPKLQMIDLANLNLGDKGISHLSNTKIAAAIIFGNNATVPGIINMLQSAQYLHFLALDSRLIPRLMEVGREMKLTELIIYPEEAYPSFDIDVQIGFEDQELLEAPRPSKHSQTEVRSVLKQEMPR